MSGSLSVRTASAWAWSSTSAMRTRRPSPADLIAASTIARLSTLLCASPDGIGAGSQDRQELRQ